MKLTILETGAFRAPRRGLLAVLTAAILAAPGMVEAQGPGGQGGQGPQGGPPAEALEACQGQQAGAACTMSMPGRDMSVSGQCVETPDQQVACLPEGAALPPKR